MLNLLLGGAAAYGLAVGALYLFQDSLLFPRGAARAAAYSLPERAERVALVTAEGDRLVGAFLPSARRPGRGLLLGFGGNAWNADDLLVFLGRRVPDHDIVVFHYRGYAPSGGRPSEATLAADALLVHDWAVGRLAPRRIVAVGLSLGSAVAGWLAARRPIDGLVLVTPFDSIEALARARYPWVPVGALLRHRFPTDRHLRGLDVPVAVIAAEHDRIVPRERTEALVRVLARPVLVATVPGSTHTGIYDREEFDHLLREALAALETATPPSGRKVPGPDESTAGTRNQAAPTAAAGS